LLLQPLYSFIGSAIAAQELLLETASLAAAEAAAVAHVTTAAAAAVRRPYSAELSLLHELGWQLGVAVWQEDWQRRCREPAAAAALVADGGNAAAAAAAVIEGSAGSGKALVRSLLKLSLPASMARSKLRVQTIQLACSFLGKDVQSSYNLWCEFSVAIAA
jgi:hypothetical protein